MLLNELREKRVALLGFGVEGYGTYQFIRKEFPEKPLIIFDESPSTAFSYPGDSQATLSSDPHTTLILGDSVAQSKISFDILIKGPGLPRQHHFVTRAASQGCRITTHMEIFFEICPLNRIVGITGTKGKSTTTSLLHAMAQQAGHTAVLGGNIGVPPLPLLNVANRAQYFILELSSYQLEPLCRSPHIAVLLDIVPEHLTYHGSFEQYVAAKENITRYQTPSDFLVYNNNCQLPRAIASRTIARTASFSATGSETAQTYLSGTTIVFNAEGHPTPLADVSDITLPGAFNIQNVMAAATAAMLLRVDPEAIRVAIKTFKPLPHRLERVGARGGITFVDDSISTVPEATISALDTLGPSVFTLILGGHDRGLDFTSFAKHLINYPVGLLILFPETGERIWNAVVSEWSGKRPLPQVVHVSSMQGAVRAAFAGTPEGRICLLSPASPSFGIFKDYRDRGDQFRDNIFR